MTAGGPGSGRHKLYRTLIKQHDSIVNHDYRKVNQGRTPYERNRQYNWQQSEFESLRKTIGNRIEKELGGEELSDAKNKLKIVKDTLDKAERSFFSDDLSMALTLQETALMGMHQVINSLRDIKAGGPGSGCKGSHCGRPRSKDEDRQARAKASYNPSNRAKQIQAEENEKKLAQAIGGASHIGDNAPFDVILKAKRVAFEVKTIIAGKKDAITMHPSSRMRKEKAWKDMKLRAVYTIIFDDRHGKIYYAEGVKSFRIKLRNGEQNPKVKEIKDLKELRRII